MLTKTIRQFSKYSLAALLVLLTGCATGRVGHLTERTAPLDQLHSSDSLVYQDASEGAWVRMNLSDFKLTKLFPAKFEIFNVLPDGSRFLLRTWRNPDNSDSSSGLHFYDSEKGLREAPQADSGLQYDHAVFSPDGQHVLASASRPYLYGIPVGAVIPKYDDRIYILDYQSLTKRTLKKFWGDAQVSDLAWGKNLKTVTNHVVKCSTKDCDSQTIKRDIDLDTISTIDPIKQDKFLVLKFSKLKEPSDYIDPYVRPRSQCGTAEIKTIALPKDDSGLYDVSISVTENGNSREIVRIRNRKEAGSNYKPLQPITPQFTSDCQVIVFSLGVEIFGVSPNNSKIAKIAKGNEPFLVTK
jgi:hypothetical protein